MNNNEFTRDEFGTNINREFLNTTKKEKIKDFNKEIKKTISSDNPYLVVMATIEDGNVKFWMGCKDFSIDFMEESLKKLFIQLREKVE